MLKTLSLVIIRPYYSKEIENIISNEKNKREKEVIEHNKDKIYEACKKHSNSINKCKKILDKGNKSKCIFCKARKLDKRFWKDLKKEQQEVVPIDEFYSLLRYLQSRCSLSYNIAMSKVYTEAIIKNKKGSIDKLVSKFGYTEASKILKDASLTSGIRQKIISNIGKSKFYDLKIGKISLPTVKAQTFPIPIYKQTSGDKYKGFEIVSIDKEFIIKISFPQYKVKEVEKIKDKKKIKYKEFTIIDSRKKKNIMILLSTMRRRRNFGWSRDEGTDSEIRKLITFNKDGKTEFQKEWEDYIKKVEKSKKLKKYWNKKSKKKKWEKTKEWLINKYKIGWLEINRGKKIGEKQKWFVNLVIEKPPKELNLDKNIVGGIDIGISNPVVCALNNSLKRYSIFGNEVIDFNKKVLQRRRNIMKDNRDKRRGHGSSNKMKIIKRLDIKNNERRKKIMERWVKNITKFFIDNNVGIAQRENLSSLSDKKDDTDFFKFQRMFWTRYKFQNMLDNKLKEVGIKIIEINPKYTSQICSNPKCRHWNKYFDFEYRRENKFPLFKCEMCEKNDKYKDDEKKKYRGISADYNAAKNIATPNIEKIIEKITKNDKCNCDFCKMKA